MKYAFIVLVACYLLVYGCGPDSTEKAEEKKSQVTTSAVQQPAAPAEQKQAAAPAEQKKPAQMAKQKQAAQPAVAPLAADKAPAEAGTKQEAAAAPAEQPRAAKKAVEAPSTAAVTEQPAAPGAETAPPPAEAAAQTPEEGQPAEAASDLVTLPCGMVVPRSHIPADAPCFQPQLHPCPHMGAQHPPLPEDVVVMPCGRAFVRHPGMAEGLAELDPGQPEPLAEFDTASDDDLADSMEKMVEATNDMVMVTKQLVVATQKMVKATEEAARRLEHESAAAVLPAEPPATAREENANTAMHEAILATQKALEALNQVLPKALEQRQ